MRLEQLVLYGPGHDDRLKFGPHLTVFSGLAAPDRFELIETIVDALTGRLSNASVVFTDHRGRRVFADRTGATFADSGVVAPGPSDLLGRDPSTVAELLTVNASSLGLGGGHPLNQLRDQLEVARAELAALHSDHIAAVELAEAVEKGRAYMIELDDAIASADELRDRWKWQTNRRNLDELRTRLTLASRPEQAKDRAILASVDALRDAGSAWADLAAEVADQAERVGPLPEVSAENLARVAATPDEPPATFLARLEAWRAAQDALTTAESELARVAAPATSSADPLVEAFARLDQSRLWAAHRRLTTTADTYHALGGFEDPDIEESPAEQQVDLAHREVVRAQRLAAHRTRPGLVAAGALTGAALLATYSGQLIAALLALVGAAIIARWLVVEPRRRLADAEAQEQSALSLTGVSSWLGLHLRRLDSLTEAAERKRIEGAANNWIVAQVEWEEVAGNLTVEDLTARADEVRERAIQLDVKAMGRRRDEARVQRESAAATERTARASMARGLEHFGFTAASVANLDPEELASTLNRRIEAGRLARRAVKLASLQRREREAAAHLESILGRLGFTDGDLAHRLDRAIAAVGAARQRQEPGAEPVDRTELEAEIARLEVIVRRTARPGWEAMADLAEEPTDPEVLTARRRELARLLAANGSPDAVGAERRYQLGLRKVRELEDRLADQTQDRPTDLAGHLQDLCHRTSWIDGAEETMPLIVDDALASLPLSEKVEALDLLASLSRGTQVMILTDDHLVTRWARSRVGDGAITLFELEPTPVTAEPALA